MASAKANESKFALFCNKLAFLQADLPGFEDNGALTLLGSSNGYLSDFLPIGRELLLNLLRIAKRGEDFINNIEMKDYLDRMIGIIDAYYSVLYMPPKVLGGLCQCILGTKRSGPAFERRCAAAYSKAAYAIFTSKMFLVESKLSSALNTSQSFLDISNRAGDIFKRLSNITTKGNDNIREKARVSLQSCSTDVEIFVNDYFDELFGIVNTGDAVAESNAIKLEALRRIRIVNDNLVNAKQSNRNENYNNNSSNTPTSLNNNSVAWNNRIKLLVKCQSSLQEIMNTAMSKCKPTISANSRLVQNIEKLINDSFQLYKQRFKESDNPNDNQPPKMKEELAKYSEDVALRHSEFTALVTEANTRWEQVTGQCVMRPVAIFVDDTPPPVVVQNHLIDIDPIKNTGKSIGNIGVKGVSLVKEGAINLKDNLKDGAINLKDGALNVGNKAIEFLSLGPDAPPKPSRGAGTSNNNNMNANSNSNNYNNNSGGGSSNPGRSGNTPASNNKQHTSRSIVPANSKTTGKRLDFDNV